MVRSFVNGKKIKIDIGILRVFGGRVIFFCLGYFLKF